MRNEQKETPGRTPGKDGAPDGMQALFLRELLQAQRILWTDPAYHEGLHSELRLPQNEDI